MEQLEAQLLATEEKLVAVVAELAGIAEHSSIVEQHWQDEVSELKLRLQEQSSRLIDQTQELDHRTVADSAKVRTQWHIFLQLCFETTSNSNLDFDCDVKPYAPSPRSDLAI